MAVVGVWEIRYTIEDAKREQSTMVVYFPRFQYTDPVAGTTVVAENDPAFYAFQLGLALDGIINGRIVSISLSATIKRSDFVFWEGESLRTTASPESDVEEGVIATYRVEGTNPNFRHRIPTFREDMLTVGGDVILDDTGLFFNAGMVEKFGGTFVFGASDYRSNEIIGFFQGKQDFKKSRKNKRRR